MSHTPPRQHAAAEPFAVVPVALDGADIGYVLKRGISVGHVRKMSVAEARREHRHTRSSNFATPPTPAQLPALDIPPGQSVNFTQSPIDEKLNAIEREFDIKHVAPIRSTPIVASTRLRRADTAPDHIYCQGVWDPETAITQSSTSFTPQGRNKTSTRQSARDDSDLSSNVTLQSRAKSNSEGVTTPQKSHSFSAWKNQSARWGSTNSSKTSLAATPSKSKDQATTSFPLAASSQYRHGGSQDIVSLYATTEVADSTDDIRQRSSSRVTKTRKRSGSVNSQKSMADGSRWGAIMGHFRSASTSSITVNEPTKWERPMIKTMRPSSISEHAAKVAEASSLYNPGTLFSSNAGVKGIRKMLNRRRTSSDGSIRPAMEPQCGTLTDVERSKTKAKLKISSPIQAWVPAGMSSGAGVDCQSISKVVLGQPRVLNSSTSYSSLASRSTTQDRTLIIETPSPQTEISRPRDSPTRTALNKLDRVLMGQEPPPTRRRDPTTTACTEEDNAVGQPLIPKPVLANLQMLCRPKLATSNSIVALSPPSSKRRPTIPVLPQFSSQGSGPGVPIIGSLGPPPDSEHLENPHHTSQQSPPAGIPINQSVWSSISLTASELRERRHREDSRKADSKGMERKEREKELRRVERRREREERKRLERDTSFSTDHELHSAGEVVSTCTATATSGLSHSSSLTSFDSEDSALSPVTPPTSYASQHTLASFTESSYLTTSPHTEIINDRPSSGLTIHAGDVGTTNLATADDATLDVELERQKSKSIHASSVRVKTTHRSLPSPPPSANDARKTRTDEVTTSGLWSQVPGLRSHPATSGVVTPTSMVSMYQTAFEPSDVLEKSSMSQTAALDVSETIRKQKRTL